MMGLSFVGTCISIRFCSVFELLTKQINNQSSLSYYTIHILVIMDGVSMERVKQLTFLKLVKVNYKRSRLIQRVIAIASQSR